MIGPFVRGLGSIQLVLVILQMMASYAGCPLPWFLWLAPLEMLLALCLLWWTFYVLVWRRLKG